MNTKEIQERKAVFFSQPQGTRLEDQRNHRRYEFLQYHYTGGGWFTLKWLPEAKYQNDVDYVKMFGSTIACKLEDWWYYDPEVYAYSAEVNKDPNHPRNFHYWNDNNCQCLDCEIKRC